MLMGVVVSIGARCVAQGSMCCPARDGRQREAGCLAATEGQDESQGVAGDRGGQGEGG